MSSQQQQQREQLIFHLEKDVIINATACLCFEIEVYLYTAKSIINSRRSDNASYTERRLALDFSSFTSGGLAILFENDFREGLDAFLSLDIFREVLISHSTNVTALSFTFFVDDGYAPTTELGAEESLVNIFNFMSTKLSSCIENFFDKFFESSFLIYYWLVIRLPLLSETQLLEKKFTSYLLNSAFLQLCYRKTNFKVFFEVPFPCMKYHVDWYVDENTGSLRRDRLTGYELCVFNPQYITVHECSSNFIHSHAADKLLSCLEIMNQEVVYCGGPRITPPEFLKKKHFKSIDYENILMLSVKKWNFDYFYEWTSEFSTFIPSTRIIKVVMEQRAIRGPNVPVWLVKKPVFTRLCSIPYAEYYEMFDQGHIVLRFHYSQEDRANDSEDILNLLKPGMVIGYIFFRNHWTDKAIKLKWDADEYFGHRLDPIMTWCVKGKEAPSTSFDATETICTIPRPEDDYDYTPTNHLEQRSESPSSLEHWREYMQFPN